MDDTSLDYAFFQGTASPGINAAAALAVLAAAGVLLWWLRGEGVFGIFGNLAGFIRFLVGVYAWTIAFILGVVAMLWVLKAVGLVDVLPRIAVLLAMIAGAATPMLMNYLWSRFRPGNGAGEDLRG